MRYLRCAAFTSLILAAATTVVSAKGITTRIAIHGGGLAAPIEIADPVLVQQFNVWSGPGTFMNDIEGTEGFIIDWAAGAVQNIDSTRPQYEVLFFVSYPNARDSRMAYVVRYTSDTSGGYVYLPGPNDSSYRLNTRAIHRGREGQWFRATRAWQELVGPLVARAQQR
jgi:hypothetical protein